MHLGLISNFQRYSLHDGPGIRTTVFLKGCPLSCAWCHNPETLSRRPEIMMVETRCVRCGTCVAACPNGRPVGAPDAIVAASPDAPNAEASCSLCGECVEACPTGARVMIGRQMTVPELMDQLLADRVFFGESGGGVTFSGGEPLLQFEFLQAALTACRERGLRTAVDTSGFAPREQLLAVAALADLILYDVKTMDDAHHREIAGVPNRLILENLEALGRVHPAIWLRVPIIPGVNDSPAALEAIARFGAGIPGVRQINLLPYHQTGLSKRRRLRHEDFREPFATPTAERMEHLAGIFRQAGLDTRIGG
jgi:pyruvate formate lyase activating enzyme